MGVCLNAELMQILEPSACDLIDGTWCWGAGIKQLLVPAETELWTRARKHAAASSGAAKRACANIAKASFSTL
jgi:hypothetical protein